MKADILWWTGKQSKKERNIKCTGFFFFPFPFFFFPIPSFVYEDFFLFFSLSLFSRDFHFYLKTGNRICYSKKKGWAGGHTNKMKRWLQQLRRYENNIDPIVSISIAFFKKNFGDFFLLLFYLIFFFLSLFFFFFFPPSFTWRQ